MINDFFKLDDEDLEKDYDGFLQFLAKVTRHDDHRVAIHIPSKMWLFYKLGSMSYRPKVWLKSASGDYLVTAVFGNLNSISSKSAGRLTLDLSDIPYGYEGQVIQVTIRYKKKKLEGIFSSDVEAPTMTRK